MTYDPDYPLCGRCLGVLNASSSIQAEQIRGDDRGRVVSFNHSPTDAHALRAWAEDKLASGDWHIDIDRQPDMLRPVATWHGDPVCAAHLRALVLAERTGGVPR